MKLKYYSVASYIYKDWRWAYHFEHDKKIKTKNDYSTLVWKIQSLNISNWEHLWNILVTNIITFINK